MIKNEDGSVTLSKQEFASHISNVYVMYGISLTLPDTLYSEILGKELQYYEEIRNS